MKHKDLKVGTTYAHSNVRTPRSYHLNKATLVSLDKYVGFEGWRRREPSTVTFEGKEHFVFGRPARQGEKGGVVVMIDGATKIVPLNQLLGEYDEVEARVTAADERQRAHYASVQALANAERARYEEIKALVPELEYTYYYGDKVSLSLKQVEALLAARG